MKFKEGMRIIKYPNNKKHSKVYKILEVRGSCGNTPCSNCKGELKMINTYSKKFYVPCTSKIIEQIKTGRYSFLKNSIRRLN